MYSLNGNNWIMKLNSLPTWSFHYGLWLVVFSQEQTVLNYPSTQQVEQNNIPVFQLVDWVEKTDWRGESYLINWNRPKWTKPTNHRVILPLTLRYKLAPRRSERERWRIESNGCSRGWRGEGRTVSSSKRFIWIEGTSSYITSARNCCSGSWWGWR